MVRKTDLIEAVRAIYFSGVWTCKDLTESQQAELWENLKNAAGLTNDSKPMRGIGKNQKD
jgi:hypothetical protein